MSDFFEERQKKEYNDYVKKPNIHASMATWLIARGNKKGACQFDMPLLSFLCFHFNSNIQRVFDKCIPFLTFPAS